MGFDSITCNKLVWCTLIIALWTCTLEGSGHLMSSEGLLPPPKTLLEDPLITHQRTLVGGGPSNQYQRSLASLDRPVMGNFENSSLKIMEDVKAGLRYLFQTENKWTLALSGGGSLAMDIILDNLVEPGDVVLIPTFGLWGVRAADIVERYGGIPKKIEAALGSAFSLKEIEDGIVTYKPAVVYITNGESSTGVHQSLQGVGELCRKHYCLLVVDLVATIGVIPFHMDSWKVDAVFSNTQKALGSPTGMAPISYGTRSIEKITSRKTKPKSYFADLKNNWIRNNYWGISDPGAAQTFHSSYPILQIYALREALASIATEGLAHGWARHFDATAKLYTAIDNMTTIEGGSGVTYFVSRAEHRLTGTVALLPPKGLDPKELMNLIRQMYSIEINIGIGPMTGKIIRIGVLGPNARPDIVDEIVSAIKYGLKNLKK